MATPSEKLAESLDVLKALQDKGVVAIRTKDLSRTHRERLVKNGFLKLVMKGWFIQARPDETPGESTAWYASYWDFCAAYLTDRFGDEWVLSPEQSVLIHVENMTVPRQLLVRASNGKNNITQLPFETSLIDTRSTTVNNADLVTKEGLSVYALPLALIMLSPNFFVDNPSDARAALSQIGSASEVLGYLLAGNHSTIAGRLAGAFRNIGRDRIANDILGTMSDAGYSLREIDPFESQPPVLLSSRPASAYANRLILMWQEMREPVLARFPAPPGIPADIGRYMKDIDDSYVTDAYHSLSIEGYRVSPELIERVRSGVWTPDDEAGKKDADAMAARGYWQAYQAVRDSIGRIFEGENAGAVVDNDHGSWYRQMFAPSVAAGLLKSYELAGYRNMPVYIRQSKHVPPNQQSVRDAMPVFFDLLQQENEPAVRVVLGHFFFVFIHPYTDGNGRIGRFLMNAMLASGGYPWTVIQVEQRRAYMAALEDASVRQNIAPFADFLATNVESKVVGSF